MNYSQVREIVIKHDPLELIEIGCPENEYDVEIKDVFSRLRSSKVTESYDLVMDVFSKWFWRDYILDYKENFRKLARDLDKLL